MTEPSPSSPRVHPFKVLSSTALPEMNRLQRSFYQKHYRPQFEAGIALDIEGQYGYPTVVLHELLERWPDEPELVMEGMRRLLEAYRRTSVSASARWCLADMHLLRGEWAEAVGQLGRV